MRLYVVDGEYYPSITTVLGRTAPKEKVESLQKWREAIGENEADAILKDAAESGTHLHLLVERFLRGDDLLAEQFSEKVRGGFNSLKSVLKKISNVWGQEVPLYSKDLGIAGRCDCIGVFNGLPSIIDFKTSRKIKRESDIEDYFLQMTAYSIMHNEMFGTDIKDGVIIMSSEFSFPQVFKKDLRFYKENLRNRVNSFYQSL
jgi:hypothetical protein